MNLGDIYFLALLYSVTLVVWHKEGFVDIDLGSSPVWWAATVATYCPSRPGELPKLLLTKPHA